MPRPTHQRNLVIMVKEPRPGRVKTRLAAGIGNVAAVWWFRHQANRIVRSLSADSRWNTLLAVSPDREGMQSRFWPVEIPKMAQGGGDLGVRMARILRNAPNGPVVIVGADIPGITPAHIERAFRVLGNDPAVFGPAEDGGYWLMGLRASARAMPGLFTGVRWSSKATLADTLDNLQGRSVGFVQVLRDVDTVDDL